MPDRPTHAAVIHPTLVELPLWLAWRTIHGAQRARAYAADLADTCHDPEAAADIAGLAVRLGIGACLVDIAALIPTIT